jgi:hypothetical protein
MGLGAAQVDDRGTNQDEGEERTHAHQFAQHVDRRHGSDDGDEAADDEMADIGRPQRRMNAREQRRQQAVVRHGREDAALAIEQDEDDGGEPDQRAQLDEQREPFMADDAHALGRRIGHVQLGIRHQSGQHGGDGDVEDGRDHERPQNADRHVALRQFRFLRGGRDGVKADEGEEHD